MATLEEMMKEPFFMREEGSSIRELVWYQLKMMGMVRIVFNQEGLYVVKVHAGNQGSMVMPANNLW